MLPKRDRSSSSNGSTSRRTKRNRRFSRKSLAATRLQKLVRGKQTRKQHARSIEQIYRNVEIANTCAICGERMLRNEHIARLECGHNFHANCVGRWFNIHDHTCPICRTHITNNDYENLRNQDYNSIRQALDNRDRYRNEVIRLSEELRLIANELDTIPSYNRTSINPHSRAYILTQRVNQIREELSRASQNFEEARHAIARLEDITLPTGN